jgi:hypothetical protein
MRRDDPRHGTSAGYQTHKREGKTPCKPCRDAYAAWMKEYRAQKSDWRAQQSARTKALTRLAHAYRDDFQRLYAEERMKQRGGAA